MKNLVFVLCLLFAAAAHSQTDSLHVEQLLREGAQQPAETNLVVYFAKHFIGTPYVAATLEVNPTEQLVVNLRQLDCTTYVETVLALTLTTRQGDTTYAAYCKNLTRLRYHQGRLGGYPSRNHYFTQWISSNERLGLVQEISAEGEPFTAMQTISLHYMSQHPHLYPMLKNDTAAQRRIKSLEMLEEGRQVRYIPRTQLTKTRQTSLGIIRDGDILAIVTKKDGLDTSHLGFALWDDDGRLHLLNASQIHKKVVLEPLSLYDYMLQHPSQLGIRVIRMH